MFDNRRNVSLEDVKEVYLGLIMARSVEKEPVDGHLAICALLTITN